MHLRRVLSSYFRYCHRSGRISHLTSDCPGLSTRPVCFSWQRGLSLWRQRIDLDRISGSRLHIRDVGRSREEKVNRDRTQGRDGRHLKAVDELEAAAMLTGARRSGPDTGSAALINRLPRPSAGMLLRPPGCGPAEAMFVH
jgi:hypothetical protein